MSDLSPQDIAALQEEAAALRIILLQLRKQNLDEFFKSCHELNGLYRPVDPDEPAITGKSSNPIGRWMPRTYSTWENFEDEQNTILETLKSFPEVWSDKQTYDSKSDFDFLTRNMKPISSEQQLVASVALSTERPVEAVAENILNHDTCANSLSLNGRLKFEPGYGFKRSEGVDKLTSEPNEEMAVGETSQSRTNTKADQFCVLWDANHNARPLFAIEYKSPHKATIEAITEGLNSDIAMDSEIMRGMIDAHPLPQHLVALILTQLFSYMVDKCLRYGYLCTGQALIFMHIGDDPNKVFYHLSIPKATDSGSYDFKKTAVPQILAFALRAVNDQPPSNDWRLRTWKLSKYTKLDLILPSEAPSPVCDDTPYKDRKSKAKGKMRQGCAPDQVRGKRRRRSSSEEDDHPTTPSKRSATRSQAKHLPQEAAGTQQQQGSSSTRSVPKQRARIQNKEYCTQDCLRGLLTGSAIYHDCPNVKQHDSQHISPKQFRRLLREQLATDTGDYADSYFLYKHGARGTLMKVCLTSHGYTFVAKCCSAKNQRHLQNERTIYDNLIDLQGDKIPVCLGLLDLEIPYIYDGVCLEHLLLLSWGGISLADPYRNVQKDDPPVQTFFLQAQDIVKALHDRDVLHGDIALRNILLDTRQGKLMLIDFERSKAHTVLQEITNRRPARDPFDHELKLLREAFA